MAVAQSQSTHSKVHVAHEAPLLRGYSRYSPSHRDVELLGRYEQLHREGERRLNLPAQETFPGVSLLPHVPGKILALRASVTTEKSACVW